LIVFVGAERFYAMVNFFKLRMSGKEAQNFIFHINIQGDLL